MRLRWGHRGPPKQTDTHTSSPGDSKSSKPDGAKQWRENQRLLLLERAGVWAALQGRGTQREREAGSQARQGNTTGCWRAHSGTCGDGLGCSRGSLEHRDRRGSRAGETPTPGVPAAKATQAPEPAPPLPLHRHPRLAGWTRENRDRGKRVSHVTVWERWVGVGGRKQDAWREMVCLPSKSTDPFLR